MAFTPYVSGTVGIRPIRIGLAILPGSVTDFIRAIETACSVWGGFACPILVVSDVGTALRQAEHLGIDVIAAISSSDTIDALTKAQGYEWRTIQNAGPLDPDGHGYNRVLTMEHVLPAAWTRREPQECITWDDDHPLSLLYSAWFGRYAANEAGTALKESFERRAKPTLIASGEAAPRLLVSSSPVELTSHEVYFTSREDAGVAVVDPSSLEHMIALWNLRARGHAVVPWPIGVDSHHQEIRQFLSLGPTGGWPRWADEAQVTVWAESPAESELLAEIHRLVGDAMVVADRFAPDIHSIPRPTTTGTDFARQFSMNFDWHTHAAVVQLPKVDFLPRRKWYAHLGCVAVDVEVTGESGFPPGWKASALSLRTIENVVRRTHLLEPFVRPTSRGVIASVDATSETFTLPFFSTLSMIEELLRPTGLVVNVTPDGRYMARLIDMLGGASEDSAANQQAVRAVLWEASKSVLGRPVAALKQVAKDKGHDWRGLFKRSDNHYAQSVVEWLAARRALRARLKIRCPSCGTDGTYAPEDLGQQVVCQMCDDSFPLAMHLVAQKLNWLLATSPVMPTSRLSEMYPVMATVSIFSSLLSHAELPHYLLGVEVRGPSLKCELDVVVALQDHVQPLIVIGEAKSYSDLLSEEDVNHMREVQRALRSEGVDCYVLFATLREQLEPSEVALLRRVCDEAEWELRSSSGGSEGLLPIVFTGTDLSVASMDDRHPSQIGSPRRSVGAIAVETCKRNLGLVHRELVNDGNSYRVRISWTDQATASD